MADAPHKPETAFALSERGPLRELLLREFIDLGRGISEIFCAIDGELRLLWWNDELARVTGLQADQLRDSSVLELFTFADAEELKSILRGSAAIRMPLQVRNIRSSGSPLPFRCYFQRVYGSGGRFEGTLIIGRATRVDPVVLKSLQEQADFERQQRDELERKLHSVLTYSKDMVWDMDAQGRFSWVSPQCRLIGYEPRQMVGRVITDFMEPDEAERFRERFGRRVVERHPFEDLEYRMRDGQGREIFIEVSGEPRFDDEGRFIGFSGATRDVTRHRQIQRNLVESEARFRTVFDQAPVGLALSDGSGCFTMVNQRCCEILGYSREELLGIKAAELTHPEDQPAEFDNAQQLKVGRIPQFSMEKRFRQKDGSYVWVNLTLAMIGAAGGLPNTVLGILEDITPRKNAENTLLRERTLMARHIEERTMELSRANLELARAARHKDEFLASMSHELRTPLSAIIALTESLKEQVRGPLNHHQLQSVEMIRESGQHLLSLINDILDLSKIGAGKLELFPEPLDVVDVALASLVFIRQMAVRKELEVVFEPPPHPQGAPLLRADHRRLKQILVNLLANAVKFTPERGRIGLEVEYDRVSEVVRFIVWDTGIGIKGDDVGRLFQPFVQLDSKLSRRHEGTGLGLSLVARLTQAHGGQVGVESRAGQGSRFWITLPWPQSEPCKSPKVE